MLTMPETGFFALAVLLSLYLTSRAVLRILRIIQRGHGRPDWSVLWRRLITIPPYRFLSAGFPFSTYSQPVPCTHRVGVSIFCDR